MSRISTQISPIIRRSLTILAAVAIVCSARKPSGVNSINAALALSTAGSAGNQVRSPDYAPSNRDDQTTVSIRSFNCYGDDEHDDTACFIAARNHLQSHIRADSIQGSNRNNRLGGIRLYVPAGTYLVTQPEALMSAGFRGRTQGYRLEGDGSGLSFIDYRPAGPGALLSNRDAFFNVGIRGISFSSTSGADFLDSYSTGGAQNYLFSDVEWVGRWQNLFKLTGNNNNSEWEWNHVLFAGTIENVLYIPEAETSDQFLNYWFHNSRIDLEHGNFINAFKGGHFTVTDCDFSALHGSGNPSNPNVLFALRGRVHARGVTHFECKNSRFELTTTSIKVLYSEWGNYGEVSFEDDDFSSQANKYPPQPEFELNMAGAAGAAQYNFLRSHLIGSVKIDLSDNDWGYRRNVSFEDVQFISYDDYSQAVKFELPLKGSNYGGIPIVECARCTGANRNIQREKLWKPSVTYPPGATVFSNGYLYNTTSGGTSGTRAPAGRIETFDDGGVKWSAVDIYWGSDYAQNAELRPWPYPSNGYSGPLKTAIISDPTNYNNLPHRMSEMAPGFGRVILPAYATIFRIQLIIVPGSTRQTSAATYVARTDNYSPKMFFTNVFQSLRQGGNYDYNLPIPFNVGTDLGSRTVLLQANADVSEGAQGWFIVWYM